LSKSILKDVLDKSFTDQQYKEIFGSRILKDGMHNLKIIQRDILVSGNLVIAETTFNE